MNQKLWDENRDITLDIFAHHDIYDGVNLNLDSLRVRLSRENGLIIDFYKSYDLLFSVSKSNIYDTAVLSAHIIRGLEFCCYCIVNTFNDDKKHFDDINKLRKV